MNKLSIASFTNVGYWFHSRGFEPVEEDLTGTTVLVTGATGGIGLEVASTLSALGARVIIGVELLRLQDRVEQTSRRGDHIEQVRIEDKQGTYAVRGGTGRPCRIFSQPEVAPEPYDRSGH